VTSTADTTGHPDIAEISDLTEGILPPSRTADVRHHLDACEQCADVYASLEEIRGLLGTMQGPPPMPEDVASRIDAALAAEAHVSRETSAPVDRPVGHPHAATGPGRKGRRFKGRRRAAVLGAAFTAAVLGAGALFLQPFGNGNPHTTAQGAFSQGSLKSQVAHLLSTQQKKRPGSGSQQPRLGIESQSKTPNSAESANTLIQSEPSVPNCVRQGIDRNGDLLGAQQGTYEGKGAYLVVVADASDSTRVTAYVIDTACVGRQPASPGKVLLQQTLARP
jgi:hypothetical protein